MSGETTASVEPPKVEAPTPLEQRGADVDVARRRIIDKRVQGLTAEQKRQDPLGYFDSLPQGPLGQKGKNEAGEDVVLPGGIDTAPKTPEDEAHALKLRQEGIDAAGNPIQVEGIVTKLLERQGEEIVVEITSPDGTTQQGAVDRRVLEDAQLVAEADAILGQMPDGAEKTLLSAFIRDQKGEKMGDKSILEDPQVGEALTLAADSLGLVQVAKLRAELDALAKSGDSGMQARYKDLLTKMDGRTVLSLTEAQAVRDILAGRTPEGETPPTKLTTKDLQTFVANLSAEDILVRPQAKETQYQATYRAREAALKILSENPGDLTGAVVVKTLGALGLNSESMIGQAKSLDKSLNTANKSVITAKQRYDEESKKHPQHQGTAEHPDVAESRKAYLEARNASRHTQHEQVLYQEAANLLQNTQPLEQMFGKMIDGSLDQTTSAKLLDAFRGGNMGEILTTLAEDKLPPESQLNSADLALQRQALIDKWKKRGKEGGFLALMAILMALTQGISAVTGAKV